MLHWTQIFCAMTMRDNKVERKIAQCNSRVRLVAAMGFICQLDLRFGLWLFLKIILYHFIDLGLEIDSIW